MKSLLPVGSFSFARDDITRCGSPISIQIRRDLCVIAILTTLGYIHLLSVEWDSAPVHVSPNDESESSIQFTCTISKWTTRYAGDIGVECMVYDIYSLICVLKNGLLCALTWSGDIIETFDPTDVISVGDGKWKGRAVQIEYTRKIDLFLLRGADGEVSLLWRTEKRNSFFPLSGLTGRLCSLTDDSDENIAVTKLAMSQRQPVAALFTSDKVLLAHIYESESSVYELVQYRYLSLPSASWAPVTDAKFSADGIVFGATFANRGFMVWNSHGTELLTWPEESSGSHVESSFLSDGIAALCWASDGCDLFLCENGSYDVALFSFYAAATNEISSKGDMVLAGSDSLLIVNKVSAIVDVGEGEVNPILLKVPVAYSSNHSYANWPIIYAASNPQNPMIAVAGRKGFAVYNPATSKWKTFPLVSEEEKVNTRGMFWIGNSSQYLGIVNFNSSSLRYELLIFSMDRIFLISQVCCSVELDSRPLVYDVLGNRVFLLCGGSTIVHVVLEGEDENLELEDPINVSCHVIGVFEVPKSFPHTTITRLIALPGDHPRLLLHSSIGTLYSADLAENDAEVIELQTDTSRVWVNKSEGSPCVFASICKHGLQIWFPYASEEGGWGLTSKIHLFGAETFQRLFPLGIDFDSGILIGMAQTYVTRGSSALTSGKRISEVSNVVNGVPRFHLRMEKLIFFHWVVNYCVATLRDEELANRIIDHNYLRLANWEGYLLHSLEILLRSLILDSEENIVDDKRAIDGDILRYLRRRSEFSRLVILSARKLEVRFWDHLFALCRDEDVNLQGEDDSLVYFNRLLAEGDVEYAAASLAVVRNRAELEVAIGCAKKLLVKVLETGHLCYLSDVIRFLMLGTDEKQSPVARREWMELIEEFIRSELLKPGGFHISGLIFLWKEIDVDLPRILAETPSPADTAPMVTILKLLHSHMHLPFPLQRIVHSKSARKKVSLVAELLTVVDETEWVKEVGVPMALMTLDVDRVKRSAGKAMIRKKDGTVEDGLKGVSALGCSVYTKLAEDTLELLSE